MVLQLETILVRLIIQCIHFDIIEHILRITAGVNQ